MLIKKPDDQSAHLAELEARAQGRSAEAKRAEVELRNRRAGIRGEEQAAYLIDFDYASSANWAVIHDLRLEHGGRVAQIDHLLINRWMDVYVLETKSFHAGLKITEEGEFLRWNSYQKTYEGMASPVEQNERHIQVLREVMKRIDLPMRLGLRILPSFQSFVLVSPTAKIYRPKKFDASRVIKADQLKKSIWRDIDNENPVLGMLKTAAKVVSGETVELVARQVAALHRPLRNPSTDAVTTLPAAPSPDRAPTKTMAAHKRIEPVLAATPLATLPLPVSRVAEPPPQAVASSTAACLCKGCQSNNGSILSGKYGYYFKCLACRANTAIRFTCQPGHAPRLRGERGAFYRECPQCATSVLYHRNATGAPAE
jgi:hypothetical protein